MLPHLAADSCIWETFNTVTLSYDSDEKARPNDTYMEVLSVEYKAYEFTTYFWLNFLGLFTLFTGTNVTDTTSIIFKHLVIIVFRWLKRSIKDRNKFLNNVMPKLNFSLVLLSAIIVCLKISEMGLELYKNRIKPPKTYILDFSAEAEPYDCIFCIGVEELIIKNQRHHDFELDEKTHLPKIDLNRLTFSRLESLTDVNLKKDLISKAFVSYGAKDMRLVWKIKDEVVFIYGNIYVNDSKIEGNN